MSTAGERRSEEDRRCIALPVSTEGLDCDLPVGTGFHAGITLLPAGDMRRSRETTTAARPRFLARRGISRDCLYSVRQVHSQGVQVIDGQAAAEMAGIEADGLLTDRTDAVLSVTVADCLPIFLVDRDSRAFGIVHSGWRGTGIVREAVSLMGLRFGTLPRNVHALIGPGIGPCCYTVPRERADLFAARYGTAAVVEEAGRPRLDLRAANIVLLQEAGVVHVTVVTDCTSCTPRLGSFRRQGPGDYTLMLAWIGRLRAGNGG